MKFPKRIRHRDGKPVTVYGKSAAYPSYRVAWKAGGRRLMKTFARFGGDDGALRFAEDQAKALYQDKPAALTDSEKDDASEAAKKLDEFRRATGRFISLSQAIEEFITAAKKLNGRTINEAVEGFLSTVSTVQRKPVSDAVEEFLQIQERRTKAKDGQRAQLSAAYHRLQALVLRRFSGAFSMAVCDLRKAHLEAFFAAKELQGCSAKYRNHHRAGIRQFFGWCVDKDYLPSAHRLNEAEGLKKAEHTNHEETECYTAAEFRKLLEAAEGPIQALVAIGGLTGLRTAELLRLDWANVWRIPGYIEVTAQKSKTRSRRLVEICPALEAWLQPFRSLKNGAVWTGTESIFQKAFSALCDDAKVGRKDNGLRHSFCTYHFALHANENLTAAMAGNTPGIVHANYKGLATKAEAEKWFGTAPAAPKNVIVIQAVA